MVMIAMSAGFLKAAATLYAKNNVLSLQIKKHSKEIAQATDLSSDFADLTSRIQELETEIASSEKRYFGPRDDIFAELNRFALAAQINLTAINPSERTQEAVPFRGDIALEIVPIKLKTQCGYRALRSFLKQIEGSPKTVRLENLKLQHNPNDTWNHLIEVDLKIPLLITEKKNE